jgi:gas vesicle protein
MFGFFKKDKKDKDKKKTKVDKLVMGAIMGVAIGSVIGASLLPRKKKEVTEKKIHKNLLKSARETGKDTAAKAPGEAEKYKTLPNEME